MQLHGQTAFISQLPKPFPAPRLNVHATPSPGSHKLLLFRLLLATGGNHQSKERHCTDMERERPFPPSHTDGMIFPACFLFPERFAPVCRRNTARAMGAENPWSESNQQEEKGPLISTGLREVTMDRLRTSGRAKVTIPFG